MKNTLYTYKLINFCLILQTSVTDPSAWLTHSPTWLLLPRHPSRAMWGVQHGLHQPATCPRVSLPSRNSQGNGTLPQRRSEYNLVCAHLSGGRKANNHAGLADKEQLCYMNKHRSAEQDLRHMDRFRTTLKLAWCYVSATNKTHPCSKTSLLSCCHGKKKKVCFLPAA